MQRPTIDLRSDTVTRPTPGMRRAMAEAEVGDDVFGDDPTIKALEQRTADLMGKEAAVFVPSGTMANQIAVGVHTRPGDEVLCGARSHVYVWEGGGMARLSGVTARTFEGDGGLMSLDDVRDAIRPDDPHYVRTRLVCLENTHNRAGGRVHPMESVAAIARWARGHNLLMHLDGARLMNAVVASGRPAREWAQHFDTVSICFSKGLGAPVGSALAGSGEAIRRARRLRKLFGGGMRQAGILAAAALYALEHHVDRLAEDHANARLLAGRVRGHRGLRAGIGAGRDQPGLDPGQPIGGNGRRGRRVPAVARHPGQRARAPGAPGLYPPRRLARAGRVRRRHRPPDRAGHGLGDDTRLLVRRPGREDSRRCRHAGGLHPWELDPAAAPGAQRELAERVIIDRPLGAYETIGGADVSFNGGARRSTPRWSCSAPIPWS